MSEQFFKCFFQYATFKLLSCFTARSIVKRNIFWNKSAISFVLSHNTQFLYTLSFSITFLKQQGNSFAFSMLSNSALPFALQQACDLCYVTEVGCVETFVVSFLFLYSCCLLSPFVPFCLAIPSKRSHQLYKGPLCMVRDRTGKAQLQKERKGG